MRAGHLFTLLLAPIPIAFGGLVSTSRNLPTPADDTLSEPKFNMSQKASPGTNYGGFSGQNGGWQMWSIFPFIAKDKFEMLRFTEPNCQGHIIKIKGENIRPESEKHFKEKKPTMSMKYALPTDFKLSYVDIVFWDQFVKHKKGHRCGGNIVLKIDGARGETMDGDRYACHPVPHAKCMTVGAAFKHPQHSGETWH